MIVSINICRVSGTHHERQSDWDFLAIVSDYRQPELVQATDDTIMHPSGEYDDKIGISVYSCDYFQWLIDQHVPWALPVLWHPRGAVLMENHIFNFKLEIARIGRGLKINAEVNLKQAKSSFLLRNERRRSLKRIYHVFQMLEWSTQIALHGKLVWRAACNSYYHDMLRVVEETSSMEVNDAWKRFLNVWNPIYENLERNLETSVTVYKKFEEEWERNLASSTPLRTPTGVPLPTFELCTLSFIAKYGIDALHRHLSINVHQAPSDPSVFVLSFSRLFTPLSSRIGGECNGLIIRSVPDNRTESFEVLARPIMRFHNVESDGVIPITLVENADSPVVFHEFIDGRNVMLYHNGHQWTVSSSTSLDASESIATISDAGTDTIGTRFWKVWNQLKLPLPQNVDLTYTFQLVLKEYPMILPYESDDCILVAVRNRKTGAEVDIFGAELSALGYSLPRRATVDEIKKLKSERYANSTGKYKRKALEPLQLEDVAYLSAESWSSCPGWVLREKAQEGIFCRAVVTSPLVSTLSQFRYGTRQQQEALLLPFFARYSFYKHLAVLKCPFPAVEQESNCCEAFSYVRDIFDAFCDDIDGKVKTLSEKYHDRSSYAPAAEAQFPNECHFIIWTKYKASSAKEMFALSADSTAVSCALTAWWNKNHKTPSQETNRHFCYKC